MSEKENTTAEIMGSSHIVKASLSLYEAERFSSKYG